MMKEFKQDIDMKYAKRVEPSQESVYISLTNAIKKRFHIVLLCSNFTNYHQWVKHFPSLETKMDVMFSDDLSP